MSLVQISMTFNGQINFSAQVGDIVYYSLPTSGSTVGGYDLAQLNQTFLLGPILGISDNSITVEYENSISTAPPPGAFISFVKDKRINTSSLVGYYSEVKLINNARDCDIELFSIGSDIQVSSK